MQPLFRLLLTGLMGILSFVTLPAFFNRLRAAGRRRTWGGAAAPAQARTHTLLTTDDGVQGTASFLFLPANRSAGLFHGLINCFMVPKLRLLLTMVFVVVFSFISITSHAQNLQNVGPVTVTTDKPDYAPRSNAVFTGTGFQPYEDVQLKVKNLFRACNTVTADSSYQPWTVKADADGNFITNWLVCDCAGDSLRLKASGITSGYIAYAYFSDAPRIASVDVGNQMPNPVTSGSSASYSVTVKRGTGQGSTGNFSPVYSVTFPSGLPAGVTSSFSVNNTAIGGTNVTSQNTELTLSTTAATPAGTYPFTVKAEVSGATSDSAINSTKTLVVVNTCTNPSITSATAAASPICSDATTTLTANGVAGSGATVTWWTGAGGTGTSLGTGLTLVAGPGTYYARVSGDCGTPAEASVTVEANYAPTFTVQPTNQSSTYGDASVTFSVTVSGTPEPTYQWQVSTDDGNTFSDVPGATSSTLFISNPVVSMSGSLYHVVVSNTCSNVTSDNVRLTVTPAALTVTSTSRTKVYGQTLTNADFAGTLEGVLNGDNITVTRSSAGEGAAASVNNYSINNTLVDPTNKLGNYEVSNTEGTLTVTPAALTVTADNKRKWCGQENPVFTASYTGFVNGETFATSGVAGAPEFNTTATVNSNATLYDIIVSDGSLTAKNYEFKFVSGQLTVDAITGIDASASSNPVAYGSSATLFASITPAVAGVKVYFSIDGVEKGSGITNGSGIATHSVSGLAVDVYKVVAYIASGCATSNDAYLPVYDPNGAFVTGGGWINSPAGAYVANSSLTGKANFGFNAKYKKGSNAVDGNTEFQFQAGNMNFKSSEHDAGSLVIAGAKAIFKGKGTINGAGNYGFMVSGIDGAVNNGGGIDKFRIKIWDIISGNTVYDNEIGKAENGEATTILGGGSIVIHENKGKTSTKTVITPQQSRDGLAVIPEPSIELAFKAFPNPTTSSFNVQLLSSNTKEKIVVRVLDMYGRLIEVRNNLSAGQTINLGSQYRPGMYIVEMIQGKERKQLKVLKQPD